MENSQKLDNESLTEFANRLASIYNKQNTKTLKKGKGQFFTPASVAKFMASLTDFAKEDINILDPGAGVGILSIAIIEELLKASKIKKINLVCYETDNEVVPYLKQLLEETKKYLDGKISFKYSILNKDFISSNANLLVTNQDAKNVVKPLLFDVVIANPPYFKISKSSLPLAKFKDIISGQPNMYYLFMAISAKLLNEDGQMIFITPRSFCSGLYYNKFRKWLIEQVNFANIHSFHSRRELFANENVLQENIITKFIKKDQDRIIISKTLNGDFSNIQKIKVLKKDVIYRSNGHIFFRIPSNEQELGVIRRLDTLPYNFYKLGIKVSTGKVVAFRNKPHLQNNISKNSVPLLWMHNIRNGKIEWPIDKKGKAIAIKNNEMTKWLLLESGNYLVIKRFAAKEQKKRFRTACIFEEDFKNYQYFALDNMINYIYSPDKKLNKNHIKGISRYLNLPIVDLYFRVLNGHTQVNANEIYSLPFPSMQELENLGKNENVVFKLRNNQIIATEIKQNVPVLKEIQA